MSEIKEAEAAVAQSNAEIERLKAEADKAIANAKKAERKLAIAREQIEGGASIIDINMDDAMLDALVEMDTFLKLVASEPEISRVPVMIDSSKFEVLEANKM